MTQGMELSLAYGMREHGAQNGNSFEQLDNFGKDIRICQENCRREFLRLVHQENSRPNVGIAFFSQG